MCHLEPSHSPLAQCILSGSFKIDILIQKRRNFLALNSISWHYSKYHEPKTFCRRLSHFEPLYATLSQCIWSGPEKPVLRPKWLNPRTLHKIPRQSFVSSILSFCANGQFWVFFLKMYTFGKLDHIYWARWAYDTSFWRSYGDYIIVIPILIVRWIWMI